VPTSSPTYCILSTLFGTSVKTHSKPRSALGRYRHAGRALIETARCAHARLELCESARGNLPFQRSIYFFRVLGRAASFRVLLGPTIDANKEIALALQRGESRIHRAGGQRPTISGQIREHLQHSRFLFFQRIYFVSLRGIHSRLLSS
jgi:hypothetical protein